MLEEVEIMSMKCKKIYMGLAMVSFLMVGCGNKETADSQMQEVKSIQEYSSADIVNQEKQNIAAELAELEKQEQALYDEMNSLEFISQLDMNLTSEAAYKLWDDELNAVWALLKDTLSEADFENLRNEQREWIKERDAELDKLREEEWGSAGPTIVNGYATDVTKERVYELVNYLE